MPLDDGAFISDAMTHLGLTSDAQLEALADLAKHTLSKARHGAQQLGPWNRAKILDLRAYPGIRDAIVVCFGRKGSDWIAQDRRRMVSRVGPLERKRDVVSHRRRRMTKKQPR